MREKISESIKKIVAAKQDYKCANFLGSNIIPNYNCIYHKCRGGTFDEAGYEIDHIKEYSISKNNKLENLQALCIPCHRVKTIRFNQKKKIKNTKTIKYWSFKVRINKSTKNSYEIINLCKKDKSIGIDFNIKKGISINDIEKFPISCRHQIKYFFEMKKNDIIYFMVNSKMIIAYAEIADSIPYLDKEFRKKYKNGDDCFLRRKIKNFKKCEIENPKIRKNYITKEFSKLI